MWNGFHIFGSVHWDAHPRNISSSGGVFDFEYRSKLVLIDFQPLFWVIRIQTQGEKSVK